MHFNNMNQFIQAFVEGKVHVYIEGAESKECFAREFARMRFFGYGDIPHRTSKNVHLSMDFSQVFRWYMHKIDTAPNERLKPVFKYERKNGRSILKAEI